MILASSVWHRLWGVISHLALLATKGSLSSMENHKYNGTDLRVPHGIIPFDHLFILPMLISFNLQLG